MSYKTNLIKAAIKWTPKIMVLTAANMKLKGIAKLTDFSLDLDERTAYVQATLYGEEQALEVSLKDFAIIGEPGSYQLILREAQANRPWLNNLLALVAGKAWKIPVLPEFSSQIELAVELLKEQSPEPEAAPEAS